MKKTEDTSAQNLSQARRPIFVPREWLHVAILTVIMAVIWAGVSVYIALFRSDVPPALARRIQQFSIDLDESVIETLQGYSQLGDRTILEEQRIIVRSTEDQGNTSPVQPAQEEISPTPPAQVTGEVTPTIEPAASPTPIPTP